ncbi:MAG TPA: PspC domain-containing protein [Anaerolineaceae bacterium]|nr:PspC domain-containing protein [Anaerolineaceae bacterium]HPN51891.1 PspC domain-containing protein [Anaerolineaceae bacterium]
MDNRPRLTRSQNDKMLAGVCGGLAQFFGLDVSLIRLAFVLSILFGGTGLFVYIIMCIIVPPETMNNPIV